MTDEVTRTRVARPVGALRPPLKLVFRWAQAQSLVALPFLGTVSSRRLAPWLDFTKVAALGRGPGTLVPRQADLLVVVGNVSHKLAPVLQQTHARMAHPAFVLHLGGDPPTALNAKTYATVADLSQIIPVDVVVRGQPPTEDAVRRGLLALEQRIRMRRR